MPVEIRELVIRTAIVSRDERESELLNSEKITLLKKSIVQECLRALKEKTSRSRFDR
ncbi:DUF5908 family protein [Pseudomonas sp. MWU13-2105]|uniref:DUF5908 family protein n=1 Tax=Pseudomonas sp. MWU13-2105 TaxID=2935074 RepID=UPI0020101804|nr:DUF5908 family protein [Pseudomonas sp. MWU13-2105]